MDQQRRNGLLGRIADGLRAHGLVLFGGFAPQESDRVLALPDGNPAASLLMVGNAGSSIWRSFAASPEAGDGGPDPLDRWSKRILGRLAAEAGGRAIFPSDGPPYPPFVDWAKRAAPVRESPLGMLIHPVYGLWHAYRGALALGEAVPPSPSDPGTYPCDACVEKPCLTTCPVSAFAPDDRPGGYRVDDCVGHIETPAGADCLELGCRARRACPVGRAFVYDAPQAAFHMAAFLTARQGRGV